MNGITFEVSEVNKRHTFNDWGLLLSSFEAGYPSTKRETVEIEGGNGTLDLTEVYGTIFYDDRTITITLKSLDDELRYTDKLNKITAYLHGRTFKIYTDYEKDWYYYGRVEVNKYASSKRLGTITLKAYCKPFKYKRYTTYVNEQISATGQINAKNARMDAIPTFKASASMTFTFNGNSYSLSANTETRFTNVVFKEGNNLLNFTGTGDIEIKYQEGTL